MKSLRRITTLSRGTTAALLAAIATVTPTFAWAQAPAPIGPLLSRALPAAERRALEDEVRVARVRSPSVFARVVDLQGLQRANYLSTRLRRPTVTRELMSLGVDALVPMLQTYALTGYPRALDVDERAALEVGLLEAIGALADRRAETTLRAAFEQHRGDELSVVAARGLGRLCGDGDVAYLAGLAQSRGALQNAALEGLGACHRLPAVRAIIQALEATTDAPAVIAAAHGLANAGSTWGQQAGRRVDDLPALASDALLRAYLRASADAQYELRIAMASVGHRPTLARVEELLRSAPAAQHAALQSLHRALQLATR